MVVTRALMLGVGHAQTLDTYISTEKYRGTALTFVADVQRQRRQSAWSRRLLYRADVAYTHNRADNANDMAAYFRFGYGAMRHWTLGGGHIDMAAGAQADVLAGFLYNTRGGNNPAQATMALNITPMAQASWRFHIRQVPCQAVAGVEAPVAGLMFAPHYGQSYYEIFTQGNYDHNLVATWTGNTPSVRQMLGIDIQLGHTALRLGYMGEVRQAKVNGLRQHLYTHQAMIGVVRRFSICKLFPTHEKE